MAQLDWSVVSTELARIESATAAERTAMLAVLEPGVRAEVESLLQALGRNPAVLDLDAAPPAVGAKLGPYVLRQVIGRGGMGVVYRAERHDGAFERQVAVKVADARLSAPETYRRFGQERQILASLDHPHIVRLLDAGVSDGGHRYFVMEFVHGIPVTKDCVDGRVPLAMRLKLFGDICDAVHYAHQHLVLHRDLKASNIVVTEKGIVKVLDFGIAQILQDGARGPGDSSTMLHPLSFSCASPEQLRGEPLSFASDVYALGVLLYELITGVNPQVGDGASFEDTFKRVVEQLPAAPSTRTTGVSRDLDAVVLKALAKDPAARYASVADLKADVVRVLTGRPVQARPPSRLDAALKLIRRNKVRSAAAVALLAASSVALAGYVRQAQVEQRRFEDARQLVHTVLFDIQPKMEGIPATLPLRQTLIQDAMRYLESVSRDAGRNVRLLLELSNGYQQLARVQGDVTTSSLGNQDTAAARYAKADELMQRALQAAPNDPVVVKDAALLYGRLAGFANTQSRTGDAIRYAERAVDYAQHNVTLRHDEFDAREILAGSVFYSGVAEPAGNWDRRVATFERASSLYRALRNEQPEKENLERNVGITARYLASLYHDRGQERRALEHATRARDVSASILSRRPGDPGLQLDAATDVMLLGTILDASGRLGEGEQQHRRAIALTEGMLSGENANARGRILFSEAARNFARNRLLGGDVAGARSWADRAVTTYDGMLAAGQLPDGVKWRFAEALAVRGDAENAARDSSRACADLERAVALFDETDRGSPLVDLVKADAVRTRSAFSHCAGGAP